MEAILIALKKKVTTDLASDPRINARAIRLEYAGKGLLKRKALRVSGVVSDGAQKDRVLKIVQQRAGDGFVILDNLYVSDLLWEG